MRCDAVNKEIYGLWQENHSSKKREYFSGNRKLALWSIVVVWILAVLLGLGGQLLGGFISEQAVEWTLIVVIALASKAYVTQCLPILQSSSRPTAHLTFSKTMTTK